MSDLLKNIRHETLDFLVLDVGVKGFEIYRKGLTCSARVASIGLGGKLGLGLPRAIKEADYKQHMLNAQHGR